MIRLLNIEWLKLKNYRSFWILVALYIFSVTVICSGGMIFMQFLKNKGATFDGFDPTMIPLYDYPDIWQNIGFIAGFMKVFLAFIIIISISNEASYRTLRQSIIDGLSKKEYLISKLLLISALSFASMILLFLIGLISGSFYSHVHGWDVFFRHSEFLFSYFIGIFTYLCFTLMIVLLIPKAGLIIVGLFLYTMIIEPFATIFILEFPYINDGIRPIVYYFPVFSIFNLIPFPFKRYVLQEVQEFTAIKDLLIVLAWMIFSIGMSYIILKKKDW